MCPMQIKPRAQHHALHAKAHLTFDQERWSALTLSSPRRRDNMQNVTNAESCPARSVLQVSGWFNAECILGQEVYGILSLYPDCTGEQQIRLQISLAPQICPHCLF